MAKYGNVDYWDDRYTEDKETFEWYQRYCGIRNFLQPKYLQKNTAKATERLALENEESMPTAKKHDDESTSAHSIPKEMFPCAKNCRVLNAGCGNSEVGEEMLSDGFRLITNIDFSSVVIRQMKDKYNNQWYKEFYSRLIQERRQGEGGKTKSPGYPRKNIRSNEPTIAMNQTEKDGTGMNQQMVFDTVDLTRRLPYADESFDLIFMKGTLDAVLCAANTVQKIKSMMNECNRVLDNDHGAMVIVSYGSPENRLMCFDETKWAVKTYTVPKPMVPANNSDLATCFGSDHYVYILFKSISK